MQPLHTILITGGAGFVGARLALGFKEAHPGAHVLALDNLKRRGSELNLSRLKKGGVDFVHGDVRIAEDLPNLPKLDLIIECSAEPSVLAGYDGQPRYVMDSNLFGAVNCLEWARRCGAAMIFLSTSRVYPIEKLCAIALLEKETRFDFAPDQSLQGVSAAGIAETFPMDGVRSLYGATKLAAELLIQEYAAMYGVRAVVNRCGVIAGPWQMGRVDQGIAALWVSRHIYGGPLSYIGFGGAGKQVRDMLHVDDLLELLLQQSAMLDIVQGHVFNVGGGREGSTSLCELTALCQQCTGQTIPIASTAETRAADVPLYITDNSRVESVCPWRPRRPIPCIMEDITRWIKKNEEALRPIFSA